MNIENKKSVLIIDNYDSFTYNIVHLLHECGEEVEVWKNDKFNLENVNDFDKIILSPGPGLPNESGLLMAVIEKYSTTKSILGICLGQQAIAEHFGGELFNLAHPMHGLATKIKIIKHEELLFRGIPSPFLAGRYHSWVVSRNNFPVELEITSVDEAGIIMSFAHKTLKVRGVQFHPESILSEYGKEIIQNWLKE